MAFLQIIICPLSSSYRNNCISTRFFLGQFPCQVQLLALLMQDINMVLLYFSDLNKYLLLPVLCLTYFTVLPLSISNYDTLYMLNIIQVFFFRNNAWGTNRKRFFSNLPSCRNYHTQVCTMVIPSLYRDINTEEKTSRFLNKKHVWFR